MEFEQNYFTCTLGHAFIQRKKDETSDGQFDNVLQLLETQARLIPASPALGFAQFRRGTPSLDSDNHDSSDDVPYFVTFQELYELSIEAAVCLSSVYSRGVADLSSTVGLMCNSTLDYVLTWLGLIRLGHDVLFLAPQLEQNAIKYLCQVLEVNTIFVEEGHQASIVSLKARIQLCKVPTCWTSEPSLTPIAQPERPVSKTAYICHSSGTSGKLPKPIAQSHFGVVGALLALPQSHNPATFSTTPFYHGGLPDCFRAWTSGAMAWFFPEGFAPVTAANIVSAVRSAVLVSPTPIKYFSSVPYILQMLVESDQGIKVLQDMALVGVGGAALPSKVGDSLVQRGVNLLSRMGSAECGFLASSHRDYHNDKEWEYLRVVNDPSLLQFEVSAQGVSELVVQPSWPFRVKTNRPDGSFATSDLFEPHPCLPSGWRYRGRSDGLIALANGKKLDPSPLEENMLASCTEIRDVLVFVAGRTHAGALLFPCSIGLGVGLIDRIWPHIDDMNSSSQTHARISKSMLVVLDVPQEERLPRSSKGTILRRQAEDRYSASIEAAYSGLHPPDSNYCPISDDQLAQTVYECFRQVLSRDLEWDTDLYQQGVDSMACIRIRGMIEPLVSKYQSFTLPLNVLYDAGTISALVKLLKQVRNGTDHAHTDSSAQQDMLDLVTRYNTFSDWRVKESPYLKRHDTVLLTGATGFLGAHLLSLLRTHVRKVFCLVRADSRSTARERVNAALSQYKRPVLEDDDDEAGKCQILCLPCVLTSETLGMSSADLHDVREQATLIIHSAWTVNFSINVKSFEEHVAGTRNLLRIAMQHQAHLCFISSTAAVSQSDSPSITEQVSTNTSDASLLGYSQSKWIAEQICAVANDNLLDILTDNPVMPMASIFRVGQLCGNDEGVWNMSEAFPLMLSTASITGCLPNLEEEVLDWVPAEVAARAVLDICLPDDEALAAYPAEERGITPVYHIFNPHLSPSWNTMLQWLEADPHGLTFEVTSPSTWLRRLEAALGENGRDHPSHALLDLWKGCYSRENSEIQGQYSKFDLEHSHKASNTMKTLQPITRERIARIWHWLNGL